LRTSPTASASDKAAAIKGVSHIVLTHGHGGHVGDTLDIAKTNGATVTTNYDLGMWLVSKGLEKLKLKRRCPALAHRSCSGRLGLEMSVVL
jgi:L-ascorbate metabolism protein UlaG (beta-lactamase superfamily)